MKIRKSNISKEPERLQNQSLDDSMLIGDVGIFLFVALIIAGLIFQIEVTINIFLVLAFMAMLGFLFASTALNHFRFKSYAFVSAIHHSSLKFPEPALWATVVSANRKTKYLIYKLHGVSVPLIPLNGGGRHGYYIVPEYGVLKRGGSVMVIPDVMKWSFYELPPTIQNALLQDKDFRIGDPIYFAIIPPTLDRNQLNSFKDTLEQLHMKELSADLIELIRMLSQQYSLTENSRRVIAKIHNDTASLVMSGKYLKKKRPPPPPEEVDEVS